MSEIGQRHGRALADAQQMAEHALGIARGLDGLAQDHDVEDLRRIFGEIGVRVALDDGKAARHAGVDVLLGQFQSAAVHLLGRRQMFEQRAVAAADVEHPRAVWDHFGDSRQVGTQACHHATP